MCVCLCLGEWLLADLLIRKSQQWHAILSHSFYISCSLSYLKYRKSVHLVLSLTLQGWQRRYWPTYRQKHLEVCPEYSNRVQCWDDQSAIRAHQRGLWKEAITGSGSLPWQHTLATGLCMEHWLLGGPFNSTRSSKRQTQVLNVLADVQMLHFSLERLSRNDSTCACKDKHHGWSKLLWQAK